MPSRQQFRATGLAGAKGGNSINGFRLAWISTARIPPEAEVDGLLVTSVEPAPAQPDRHAAPAQRAQQRQALRHHGHADHSSTAKPACNVQNNTGGLQRCGAPKPRKSQSKLSNTVADSSDDHHSKLDMGTDREKRHRPTVTVIPGIADDLSVQR